MKKVILSMAFLSLMCASPVFSVDVMMHDTMKDPVIQTAPATVEPKIDTKIDSTVMPKDEGVKTIDNFHEATDFVAPVDAE